MTGNRSQNNQETEMKLFQKGGPGGPGRGHKKKEFEIDSTLFNAIKEVVNVDNLEHRLGLIGISIRTKKRRKMSLEDIELALQEDLRSKDQKIRNSAVKLLLTLKRQMPDPKDTSFLIGPDAQKIIDAHGLDLMGDPEIIEDEYQEK
jgi:hypothetical protein